MGEAERKWDENRAADCESAGKPSIAVNKFIPALSPSVTDGCDRGHVDPGHVDRGPFLLLSLSFPIYKIKCRTR